MGCWRIKYKDSHGLDKYYLNIGFATKEEAGWELKLILRDQEIIKKSHPLSDRALRHSYKIEPCKLKKK